MSETYETQMSAYRSDMVLACLQRAPGAQTAGELSEFATTLAMNEGHPKACWAPLSPQSVHGILRALQRAGMAQTSSGRRNTRYSRDEPLWEPVQGKGQIAIPMYPEPEQTPSRVAAAAVGAVTLGAPNADGVCLETLSREQLLTILQLNDEVEGRVEAFVRDLRDLATRARRVLTSREASRG